MICSFRWRQQVGCSRDKRDGDVASVGGVPSLSTSPHFASHLHCNAGGRACFAHANLWALNLPKQPKIPSWPHTMPDGNARPPSMSVRYHAAFITVYATTGSHRSVVQCVCQELRMAAGTVLTPPHDASAARILVHVCRRRSLRWPKIMEADSAFAIGTPFKLPRPANIQMDLRQLEYGMREDHNRAEPLPC